MAKTKVIVLWVTDPGFVNSLVYDNGNGQVRVYEKDRYDPRLRLDGSVLPFFDCASEAMAWMLENRGKQAQVDIRRAGSFGFTREELATCE